MPDAPRITLIVARARNGVIGHANTLPWRIPEELKHFKAVTMGHPLVMGRRTFESIGRPLPGRRTIVVTHDAGWSHPGCERAGSIDEALAMAASSGSGEIFVAGGADIYRQTLDRADRLLITEVDLSPQGDTHFPPVDPLAWQAASRLPAHSASGIDYAIVDYRRRR